MELPDKQTTKLSFPFTFSMQWEDGQKKGEAVHFPLKAHFVCKPCLKVQEKFAKFHLAKENNLKFRYSFK